MVRHAPCCDLIVAASNGTRQRLRDAISRRIVPAAIVGALMCLAACPAGAGELPAPEASDATCCTSSAKFLYLYAPPARWSAAPTFYYNHDGAPPGVNFAPTLAIVSNAIAQWKSACGIEIAFGGVTTARVDSNAGDVDNMGRDGINVIGWGLTDDPFFDGSAEVVVGTTQDSRGKIVEADAWLHSNSFSRWTGPELHYTILHELGHALGIGHSNVSGALMSGQPRTRYVVRTTLADDDVRACKSLYAIEAVEFYHAQHGHYFVTASPDEVRRLDAGAIAGWARTGHSFPVLPIGATGATNTCRFWSAQRFAPKSSHFYATSRAECEAVRHNPDWLFEGEVFSLPLPDASAGCGAGTRELYRSYNEGRSGAPNHRYTADVWVQSAMIEQGWVPEGNGPLGVVACVPAN